MTAAAVAAVAPALLILLFSALGGVSLTYLWEDRATLGARLAAGICIGQAILGLIAYTLASLFGLTPGVLVAATLLTSLPLLIFPASREVRATFGREFRGAMRVRLRRRSVGIYVIMAVLAFAVLFLMRGAMLETRTGAVYTTNHHNLGDLPFHLAVTQGFAIGNSYPPQHPEFAGARLTYPFLADFIAALLVRAGASLSSALFWQNALLTFSLLTLLYRWAFLLLRGRTGAVFVVLLALLGGGLGWMYVFSDVQIGTGQSLLAALQNLPRDYTIAPTSLRWGNPITTLFVTQRGILMGVPLALLVFTLWWRVLRRDAPPLRLLLAAGAIAGLTPLVHGHTFLVLLLAGGGLAVLDVLVQRRRGAWQAWAGFFAIALLLAAPSVWYLAQKTSVHSGSFLGWSPGWDKGNENFFLFWTRNTGLFIPLTVAAVPLLWRRRRRLLLFCLPFALCFVVPNLVRLAPWVWDNIKVLYYWYLVSAVLVAFALADLWRQRNVLAKSAAVLLLVSLTLAGALDVWRMASHEQPYEVFDADGVRFARQIAQATPTGATLLHAPIHNHPALLAGRPFVMGYAGHLFSHGLDYRTREQDVQKIYAGATEARQLLAKYGVQYVVLGPQERSARGIVVNEAFWEAFPVVAQTGTYRLLQVNNQ